MRNLAIWAVVLGLALPFGCSESAAPDAAPRQSAPAEPAAPAAAAPPAAEVVSAKPARRERPVPAFEGWTLDDQRFSVAELLGKRTLIFFFNPEVKEAAIAADAFASIQGEQARENFRVVGVAMGSDAKTMESFAGKSGLQFPIVRDANGEFLNRVGLRARTAAVLVDAEGYMVAGTERFPTQGKAPASAIENQLREWLRLPRDNAGAEPVLGERPMAPPFEAAQLDADQPFSFESLRGKPVVLIFFLHTCPHCHHALGTLKTALPEIPEAQRPVLVGVSVANRPSAVRERLEEDGLNFFPVIFDGDGRIGDAYGTGPSVPVTYLIDRDGRIAWRMPGWRDDRDPPLMRMRLAALAGVKPPMLLHKTGFSGNEFCTTCHAGPHDTWQLTAHAGAFNTLVRHGKERDPECVGCHVVGWQQPGGYSLAQPSNALEGVGCETCHGRGGPHLSPDHVSGGDYEPVCAGCHTSEHSLGFDYASFLPKVSHAANQHLLGLSLEEKRKLLAAHGKPRANLLPTKAAAVGSEACQDCHASEYATWSSQPHASNDVGCESCHGPGGDHVGSDAVKLGSIVSLGDKCDSCAILKICGSCHPDQSFEFEVQEKIDLQRHGTIEAGTGRPLAPSEAAQLTESDALALIERAFGSSAADAHRDGG